MKCIYLVADRVDIIAVFICIIFVLFFQSFQNVLNIK